MKAMPFPSCRRLATTCCLLLHLTTALPAGNPLNPAFSNAQDDTTAVDPQSRQSQQQQPPPPPSQDPNKENRDPRDWFTNIFSEPDTLSRSSSADSLSPPPSINLSPLLPPATNIPPGNCPGRSQNSPPYFGRFAPVPPQFASSTVQGHTELFPWTFRDRSEVYPSPTDGQYTYRLEGERDILINPTAIAELTSFVAGACRIEMSTRVLGLTTRFEPSSKTNVLEDEWGRAVKPYVDQLDLVVKVAPGERWSYGALVEAMEFLTERAGGRHFYSAVSVARRGGGKVAEVVVRPPVS